MTKCLAAILLVAFSTAGHAQSEPEPKVRAEQVAPGVYVLYGSGGNIGVSAGADGVFLIDDQYAVMTPKITEALAKISAQPPRFVLNTHWHGDHTGGNENLAAKGTVVIAHDQVRARMSADQFSEFFQRKTEASPAGALPVITFNDSLTLHVNGDDLQAIHAPQAHTDGDVFIRFEKANVIHTGDLVFAGLYPFVDLDSGGSVNGVIAAVDRMLALSDDKTRIIPGHGEVIDREGLAAYREMLAVTSGRVRDLVKAGMSVDEVLAAQPNADYDTKLGWSFITAERYARILFRDASSLK